MSIYKSSVVIDVSLWLLKLFLPCFQQEQYLGYEEMTKDKKAQSQNSQ